MKKCKHLNAITTSTVDPKPECHDCGKKLTPKELKIWNLYVQLNSGIHL